MGHEITTGLLSRSCKTKTQKRRIVVSCGGVWETPTDLMLPVGLRRSYKALRGAANDAGATLRKKPTRPGKPQKEAHKTWKATERSPQDLEGRRKKPTSPGRPRKEAHKTWKGSAE